MDAYCPLNEFPAGSRVKIEKLCDCPRARGRLCALGLTPGTVVEICSRNGGPCNLKVRGTSVSIGGGLACRVLGSKASIEAGSGTVESRCDALPDEFPKD